MMIHSDSESLIICNRGRRHTLAVKTVSKSRRNWAESPIVCVLLETNKQTALHSELSDIYTNIPL